MNQPSEKVYTQRREHLTHSEFQKLLSTIKNRKHGFGECWLEVDDVSWDNKKQKSKNPHFQELRYNVTLHYTVKPSIHQ